ncbi:regulatory protein, FmdB family [Desulfofarcimen acetoxidans DSM 771]|uniref:Regulatory protein, FmdB family n=1 Tax=Desulfofarcimen acetoxidans (strain ATCC 49208 / DSM 771 / KCTC 5769 / VKM B-1644 / 5575) TaxID=485916 RepID=C8VZU3_DESAS|nr:zinc ribbon domain-containing protein [Desulfofarcimen acetoxidans]ACV63071.1 regulatory protein, FmdB family [Desulfofarcimen acetoxidans DSM 771]
MPIYEFICEKCGHKFTVLVALSEKDRVVCTECKSPEIKQLMSGFAVKTGNCSINANSSKGG